jgi:hypothetical protein
MFGRPYLVAASPLDSDEVVEFSHEGDAVVFGADPARANLLVGTIDEDPPGVCGKLWRMDGQLWVRNLSTSHGLVLRTPATTTSFLPPADDRRGPARSVPPGSVRLLTAGGGEVRVEQRPAASAPDLSVADRVTAPSVPSHLSGLANALCEPLAIGARIPARPSTVARLLNMPQPTAVRRLLTELNEFYLAALPPLRALVRRRLRR